MFYLKIWDGSADYLFRSINILFKSVEQVGHSIKIILFEVFIIELSNDELDETLLQYYLMKTYLNDFFHVMFGDQRLTKKNFNKALHIYYHAINL